MEYVYTAMLLHKAGKEVNEANVKKVAEAAGLPVDEGKVRALVAALDGVNIDEVVKQAALPVATAGAIAAPEKETKKEEKKEEPKEDAAAGLGALFG